MQANNFWRSLAIIGLLLSSSIGPFPVLAAPVQGLFDAEVATQDQSVDARKQALQTALLQVLQRLSAQGPAALERDAAALLRDPGRYVQQYRYLGAASELRLWVRFGASGLEQALRELGLPFWGGDRPETLVWLALEEGGRRDILGEPDDAAVKSWMEEAARQRGLPLLFPLMDMDDRARVKFSDVWGGFLGPLQAASERYRPQAVLIGRLFLQSSGTWQANWILQVQGTEQRWSDSRTDLAAVAAAGMDRLAEVLERNFARAPSAHGDASKQEAIRVVVAGVQSLHDYARLEQYLASLPSVQATQLLQMRDKRVEYQLQLQTDMAGFERAVSQGRVLVPDTTAGMLHYQLQP